MIELPKILIQEEEDVAKSCNAFSKKDILVSIHNNAGKLKAINDCFD